MFSVHRFFVTGLNETDADAIAIANAIAIEKTARIAKIGVSFFHDRRCICIRSKVIIRLSTRMLDSIPPK